VTGGVEAGHPDRLRWNTRYRDRPDPAFAAHPLAVRALELAPPAGAVLDLACGPSGAALRAAGQGRPVTAVDVSDVALDLLAREARRRGLGDRITLVHADVGTWRPAPGAYALVLCTGFWDRAGFAAVTGAVASGGVLAWEAFTIEARRLRPRLPVEWCLAPGEPGGLLPAGFTVLDQHDTEDARRRLLARRD
jgi:SAM-dependent methyltransferase